jgi:hypothetical protein
MQITLNVGDITIAGEVTAVLENARKLGYSVDMSKFYNSETHGLILIKEMETRHLRNALLKMYRAWVEKLGKTNTNKELMKLLEDGISDPSWEQMAQELYLRSKSE